MSKPSILDQKIATVRAEREAAQREVEKAKLAVVMLDHMLELLEAPPATETKTPAVPRAARGSVQAAVLAAVTERPMSVDELEVKLAPTPRTSIRKALIALGKDNKAAELSDGKWAPKSVPALGLGATSILPSHHRGHPVLPQNAGDDASVRED